MVFRLVFASCRLNSFAALTARDDIVYQQVRIVVLFGVLTGILQSHAHATDRPEDPLISINATDTRSEKINVFADFPTAAIVVQLERPFGKNCDHGGDMH